MHREKEIVAFCRANGWRCTSQRIAIYKFISGNLTHPGVDEVWEQVKQSLPTVTRGSVYRILNEFAEAGLIQRLDHIENARYDGRTESHGHFICQKCGSITDFILPETTVLPSCPAGDAQYVELRIRGICRKCKQPQ